MYLYGKKASICNRLTNSIYIGKQRFYFLKLWLKLRIASGYFKTVLLWEWTACPLLWCHLKPRPWESGPKGLWVCKEGFKPNNTDHLEGVRKIFYLYFLAYFRWTDNWWWTSRWMSFSWDNIYTSFLMHCHDFFPFSLCSSQSRRFGLFKGH